MFGTIWVKAAGARIIDALFEIGKPKSCLCIIRRENELSGPCPFAKDSPQSFEAKHWLGLETRAPNLPDPNGDPLQVASNGFEYYKRMQSPDGHWVEMLLFDTYHYSF